MKLMRISLLVSAIVSTFALISSPLSASALSGPDFRPGRIIDDAIFTNKNSMSIQQIQDFLNSKVPTCSIMHSDYVSYANGVEVARYKAPFTCLKDYRENAATGVNNFGVPYTNGSPAQINGGQSAAQMIWNAAQQYGINPQVLIVLLQKEQGLVTDDWPLLSQFTKATGYLCPDTAACNSNAGGFGKQVFGAAWQFRNDYNGIDTANFYSFYAKGLNNIRLNPDANCGTKSVNIENQATAVLYKYTPYTPNAAALNNLYGIGDGCSAYGNRNFWRYFNDWFGSTYANISNGIDYSPVFNAEYYLNNNIDLKNAFGTDYIAAFNHFISKGMNEGRQASENFNVSSYKNRYQDLRLSFGGNLPSYYLHYITTGRQENRIATGVSPITYITAYNGIDYSPLYNYQVYSSKYPDVKQLYGDDDASTIKHFVQYGMNEGRVANDTFDVNSYRNRYFDLRAAFGTNLESYYLHYINSGKSEGRLSSGNYIGGITKANNIDYSPVYELNFYEIKYPDVKSIFGLNDIGALQHFITFGMNEGRAASANFDVNAYKNRYPDLQTAFGNNLKLYYIHYITYGAKEGRLSK